MNIQTEKQLILATVSDFAAALSSASTARIPSFFTDDAVFMPNAFRSFSASDLKKQTGRFFANNAFQIDFVVDTVDVEGSFAFVVAQATASTTPNGAGIIVNKRTRDFFVLRKTGEEWKICRYIFNNAN